MKKLLALLLVAILFCACTPKPTELTEGLTPQRNAEKTITEDISLAQTDYSLKMLNEILKTDKDKNVLISPLSQALALGMLLNGAKGETKEEIEALFACNGFTEKLSAYYKALPSEEKSKINIANSIWIRDNEDVSVKDKFLQDSVDYFNAQVFKSAFDQDTVKQINKWVKENTDGMIDKVIDSIPAEAITYLVNALSFEAEWAQIYERSQVRKDTFFAINGDKQSVDFMHSDEYRYLETKNACGFMKSYKGDKYRFVALLPNEDMNIYEYVASLQSSELSEALKNPISESVKASIPKFEYDYGTELSEQLKSMGMTSAFDIYNADLSNMATTKTGNVFISRVLHKTHITVDEKGTRAGAVTVIEARNGSAPMTPKKITLDRPFLYMIIHTETSTPIFMGVLTSVK